MTTRPILFSGPMVRALQAGTKTQTRRVFKLPKGHRWDDLAGGESKGNIERDEWYPGPWHVSEFRCPYGQPGDRLWVREAWRAPLAYELTPPRDIPAGTPIVYQADGAGSLPHFNAGKLRPGMFMPRWASRITLEITGVRVERLQEISEADARAEGCTGHWIEEAPAADQARFDYRELWEQINGPGSWDANPWIWAVEFKKLEATCN